MKLGIVGVGWIARLMTSAAREVDGVDILACTAARPESADQFAREHDIEHSYRSLEEMLGDGDLDAIHIGTPTCFHHDQALLALRAGKHVLVEKPVALTEADAVEMAETADRLGLVLGVGFQIRHNAAIRELKRLLDAGAVGEPRLVRASWGMKTSGTLAGWKDDPRMSGAGSIMGLGVHVLDLCCWLLNAEPDGISAINDADSEHMDQMHLIGLSFGPCLADIQVSRRFELQPNGVVVHGTDGSLTAARTLTIDPGGTLVGSDGAELATSPRSPFVPELEAFAAAVREGGEFHADGWDGVRSVRLTEAVLAAAG